jgi:replicative superfamily II helicase
VAEVIKIKDTQDLVPTRLFPCATFPFEHFNPVQSKVFDIYDRDANFCIAASTAAGKTCMAEMILSHSIRNGHGKGVYLAPLKALAQEKIDDWTDPEHHFGDLKLSICTGDYILTKARQKELADADLILMTSEMCASRVRNAKSEKSEFLKQIACVVVDESHLLTVPGRGDHLEVALMKLTLINPNIRICFLSATMPNVDEICGWMSRLNGKNTYLLESTYRPTKLNIHYESYFDGSRDYDDTEGEKIATAIQIVNHYKDDKFLIFVHTKRTGELMKMALAKYGIQSEFHNANLTKDKRVDLEKKFKDAGGLRVIVATSTLAWGCNTPARRVVVLGVHRGMSEVATYDIFQEIGRAGRPKYDPAGDAYILLPESKFNYQKQRLQTPDRINSQLLEYVGGKDEDGNEDETRRNYKTLAFHLVSEIHQRNIKTHRDFHEWYSRTLAHHQNQWFDSDIVDNVIDLLMRCGAIKEEGGEFKVTSVGTIASMFYFSPFDVADYKRNFTRLFEKRYDTNDIAVAVALGNIDSSRFGIVSKLEREEMGSFTSKVQQLFGIYAVSEPAIKTAFAYWNLMNGRSNAAFNGQMRGLQFDFPRVAQVIQAIDQMGSKWGRAEWLRQLKMRVQYGVKPELVFLCQLPNIGAVRAQRLWDNKIRTLAEVATNPAKVKKLTNLGQDKIDEIIAEAKSLRMKEEL